MTTEEIIAEVARQQGMTPSEVAKEMKEAIREAMASPILMHRNYGGRSHLTAKSQHLITF